MKPSETLAEYIISASFTISKASENLDISTKIATTLCTVDTATSMHKHDTIAINEFCLGHIVLSALMLQRGDRSESIGTSYVERAYAVEIWGSIGFLN